MVGNTAISLSNGLSIKIKDMQDLDNNVLSWSEKENGLVSAKQIDFLEKPERECFDLTFENGCKLTCTAGHPLLTSENKWIEAKDLVIGKTKIKTGLTFPVIDIDEEMKECNNWSLQVGNLLLKTNTKKEYLKTLAFSRIIGFLITDGILLENNSCVYFDHISDAKSFINDLNLILNSKLKLNNERKIILPSDFSQNILKLGLKQGKLTNQSALLPSFVNDCPKPILREFLGGLFGGDGHTSTLSLHRGKRENITSISFSKSKTYEYINSLKIMMENIQSLLKNFIDNISIQNFKENTNTKNTNKEKVFSIVLHIGLDNLINFSEKIGFRYSWYKSQKLEAAISYKKLKIEVIRQRKWLINKVDEITNFVQIKTKNPEQIVHTKKAIIEAVKLLKEKENIIHDYAIPKRHDITDHLINKTEFGKFRKNSFLTAEQFFEKLNCLNWFISSDKISDKKFSTMNLTVIDRRPAGIHKVYDIQVEEHESFLANGTVAHNCAISHGISRFLKECLFDKSDKFEIKICTKCGLIPDRTDYCDKCNESELEEKNMPYATKLLYHQLMAMGIKCRFT